MKLLHKYYFQYVIMSIKRYINLIVNSKAYKNVGLNANIEIDEEEKSILKKQLKYYHISRPLGPKPSICYAPTKAIYFGFGGIAGPCCFNRSFIYGNYPNNSVDEIVNSKERSKLQQLLNGHDFSQGCEHCRRQIISGNFQGVEARLYDKLKTKKNYPAEMIFELDNTCNLECIMCNETFSSTIQKKITSEIPNNSAYNKQFIQQLEPYLKYLKAAKFLGGEPFLIKEYYAIWELLIASNPKCFINLQTNGTVYNSKIEQLLNRGRFQIGVSIDSLNPEKFQYIRKNARLNEVLYNLENFIKYTRKSGSFVNISVCPMQQNWEEIPEILKFCNSKNIFIYFNTVYNKGFSLQETNSSFLKNVVTLYKNTAVTKSSYISWRNKRSFFDLIHQIEAWHHIKHVQEQELIPKWPYTKQELLNVIRKLLINEYEIFETAILLSAEELPENMMLSDKQVHLLNEMTAENICLSLNSEGAEVLKKRLNNFINKNTFDLN